MEGAATAVGPRPESPSKPQSAVPSGVKAFIRLRPPSDESDIDMFDIPDARPHVLTIKDPLSMGRREHSFEFSGILDTDQSQEKVFQACAGHIVDGALLGRSGCVIAYGQTGSGKTYSVFGEGDGFERGILPRAMERFFHGVAEKEKTHGIGGDITVSFLEVYMDQVRDLGYVDPGDDEDLEEELEEEENEDLENEKETDRKPSKTKTERKPSKTEPTRQVSGGTTSRPSSAGSRAEGRPRANSNGSVTGMAVQTRSGSFRAPRGLEVRETPDGTVHVQGLSKLTVKTVSDVFKIIERGLARRATAETSVNVRSSRSHTVFSVHLPSQADSGVYLSFVDLAGSERLAKSKAEGARFQEAMAINCSLTALGKVVLALASDPKMVRHIPYRDSKLTRILSPSLGGGTQVSLLATIHPRVEDYEESLNTLSFADRCKNVARQPQVSYVAAAGSKKAKIHELQAQIKELKEMLRKTQAGQASPDGQAPGTAAPANPRVIDSIDVAIAEAIAAGASAARAGVAAGRTAGAGAGGSAGGSAADGKSAGGSPVKGAPEVNAELQGLLKVQEARNRQAKARQKATQKIEELERERVALESASGPRTSEVAELEKRKLELETNLNDVQAEIKEFLEVHASEFTREMQALKESGIPEEDDFLINIQKTLLKARDISMQRQIEFEERQKDLDEKHRDALMQLKEQQKEQLQQIKVQLEEDLKGKDERNEKISQELEKCREEEEELTRQTEAELNHLYDLVFELVQIIAESENGIYPVVRQNDGMRQTVLPEGLKPLEPDPVSSPILFSALEKAEQKVAQLEQLIRKTFPAAGRLRRLVAAANGTFDAIDVGAAHFESGLGTVSASRSSASGSFQPPLGTLHTVAPHAADQSTWSPEYFAESLVENENPPHLERQLASLSADRLRELSLALRKRALEAFSTNDERAALRRKAEEGLTNQGTQRYLNELQERRNASRASYADAVERVRRMRIDLEFRRSSILSSRSTTPGPSRTGTASRSLSHSRFRTPSAAGSRATSRPPTATGSRAGSRPTTATRSRPPTANSAHGFAR
mmetsp:Transcript_16811/g.29532  ORF Transcript_16811/g.29532 Transcript_16811/m.29532 type:complete len:1058 (-) Transcript_16811:38-3211(-)